MDSDLWGDQNPRVQLATEPPTAVPVDEALPPDQANHQVSESPRPARHWPSLFRCLALALRSVPPSAFYLAASRLPISRGVPQGTTHVSRLPSPVTPAFPCYSTIDLAHTESADTTRTHLVVIDWLLGRWPRLSPRGRVTEPRCSAGRGPQVTEQPVRDSCLEIPVWSVHSARNGVLGKGGILKGTGRVSQATSACNETMQATGGRSRWRRPWPPSCRSRAPLASGRPAGATCPQAARVAAGTCCWQRSVHHPLP